MWVQCSPLSWPCWVPCTPLCIPYFPWDFSSSKIWDIKNLGPKKPASAGLRSESWSQAGEPKKFLPARVGTGYPEKPGADLGVLCLGLSVLFAPSPSPSPLKPFALFLIGTKQRKNYFVCYLCRTNPSKGATCRSLWWIPGNS